MNKRLLIQGALYAIPAALTPLGQALMSETPISMRMIVGLIITGIIQGAIALKAFTSTTYSDSGAARVSDPEPTKVIIEQPASDPVPTVETAKTKAKTVKPKEKNGDRRINTPD